MSERGWDVVTVDIDPTFKPDVVADLLTWDGLPGHWDLLWASPPCDEFSREWMPWSRTGQPPSLELVRAVHRLRDQLKPRFWILENVKGAQPYLGRAMWVRNPVYLWGEFPPLDVDIEPWKEHLSSGAERRRAQLPYQLSLAVARAVESAFRW